MMELERRRRPADISPEEAEVRGRRREEILNGVDGDRENGGGCRTVVGVEKPEGVAEERRRRWCGESGKPRGRSEMASEELMNGVAVGGGSSQ